MNSSASLISSLVSDVQIAPSFVDRVYGEPLFHTESEVLALCYGDDETLWTIEEAGILRHWATDGRLLDRDFLSDSEDLWAFSNDAELLASATTEVALWSTSKAKELARVATDSWVTAIAFSPDGKTLASGHDNGSIRLWELPSLTPRGEIAAHTETVSALCFNAAGTELTSAGDDHLIRLWDTTSQKVLREWRGHTDRIPSLAWRPQGDFLVSAGWDTTARVWESSSDDPTILLNAHSDQVNTVVFSPDGNLLACADSDFAIHVWSDPKTGKARYILNGHADEIRALAFNRAGTRLASAGTDRVVHIWDMSTGKLVAGPNPSSRNIVALSGNSVVSSTGSYLQVWDDETGKRSWPVNPAETVHFVAASSDGKWLATSGPTLDVKLWNTETKSVERTLTHTRGPIGSPTFSADSQLLATASVSDGLAWVWKQGVEEAILVIPEAADSSTLEAMAFHPNGKYLAVGGFDWLSTSGGEGALCVWDLEARDKAMTVQAGVSAVTFDPTGHYLAAGVFSDNGQSVLVWDFEKQEKLFELPGHHDRITSVVFSPDGSWLVSGSDDCTVRVWNILTGRIVVARQFEAAVQSLAFSPDGKYLYTGNGNTTCSRLEMKKLLED